MNRKPIFAAVRQLRHGQAFTMADVKLLDKAIDEAFAAEMVAPVLDTPSSRRRVSPKGIALMHDFEKCILDAYPDPGSRDGNPWTIGWGSTGPGIAKGVRWTRVQADERFERDLAEKYAAGVDAALGTTPTTQHQFDAMVCLAYNIGVAGFKKSTVLRLHKTGDYKGAARAFLMWNKNDGKVMRGLTRRRLAEADLYDDPEVPR